MVCVDSMPASVGDMPIAKAQVVMGPQEQGWRQYQISSLSISPPPPTFPLPRVCGVPAVAPGGSAGQQLANKAVLQSCARLARAAQQQ